LGPFRTFTQHVSAFEHALSGNEHRLSRSQAKPL
jgi:hypothetical protein